MARHPYGHSIIARPVIILGQGVRSHPGLEETLSQIDAPVLTTWHAADMIRSDDVIYYGRPGIYGQRCANLVMQNADFILTIGARLSPQLTGYNKKTFARAAEVVSRDMFTTEAWGLRSTEDWWDFCDKCREDFPWLGPEHDDTKGYINSYRFTAGLTKWLKPDQIITTEMGAALFGAFQTLPVTPPQRLITSGGLGEMGCGLPLSVGAAFANPEKEILCLNTDGGMMLNLQELQTIVHNKLNIKIIVFNNDGYGMIKNTQRNLYDGRFTGVNAATGVSTPNFSSLADAFGITNYRVYSWENYNSIMPVVFRTPGPLLIEVFIDPNQIYAPKLQGHRTSAGDVVAPPLEDLWPFLPLDTLRDHMLIPLTEESLKLERT